MRILILDHYYDEFVKSHYAANQHLSDRSVADQKTSLASQLFGETLFQVQALTAAGHAAEFWPVNVPALTEAWIGEHNVALPRRRTLQPRRRHRIPLFATANRNQWVGALLRSVAEEFEADVVHVQCMNGIPETAVRGLKSSGRLVTGQSAAPVGPWNVVQEYDAFFSSLPNYVTRGRQAGVESFYLPLAFEPKLAREINCERDVPVSFVGGFSGHHLRRGQLLSEVAKSVPIDVWTPSVPAEWRNGGLGLHFHGAAWGRQMYQVLARSTATINAHGDFAEGFANNLRLYEATGMGALLITEASPNLGDLFAEDEVLTYTTPESLVEVLKFCSSEPATAATIAERGQRRTRIDHSWERRMSQFADIIEPLLDHRRVRLEQ